MSVVSSVYMMECKGESRWIDWGCCELRLNMDDLMKCILSVNSVTYSDYLIVLQLYHGIHIAQDHNALILQHKLYKIAILKDNNNNAQVETLAQILDKFTHRGHKDAIYMQYYRKIKESKDFQCLVEKIRRVEEGRDGCETGNADDKEC